MTHCGEQVAHARLVLIYFYLLNLFFECTLRDKSIVKINLLKKICFIYIINIYKVEIFQVFSQIH